MQILIESILRRPGGTQVELDGVLYHFKATNDPENLGRECCHIANAKHIQRLMGIPEGFRILETAADQANGGASITTTAPATVAAAQPPASDPGAVTLKPPQDQVLADVTRSGGPGADDPVTLTQPDPQTTSQLLPTSEVVLPTEAELEAMELATLRDQAAKELKRSPSTRAGKAVLIAQIMAVRAENTKAATQ